MLVSVCLGDFGGRATGHRGRWRLEGAEMDPPPYTRPSSLCLGSSGPHLAWPRPVLRLSAGMLGSVDLRRSWGEGWKEGGRRCLGSGLGVVGREVLGCQAR